MDGETTPDELADVLETDDDVRVVDIRNPVSFTQGHIPGSENVPFQELPQRVQTLADAEHIVTVCPHGKSSVQAARLIGSYEGCADATVESLAGGLTAWRDQYDLEQADEAETTESPF
ncbi:Rhodanese-related sulfurtransferase [Halovivax ruber XH-70]|uniref:Rhodanese-related sulfurtransferase n=1 Tax=Halovivax ruber (strain DSM 18193 / JCM 13892 / XH-70) TaxID=797302 RepID=L0IGF3_HALRX|nr:rhodanese-like domain-containing protein [Halovivax ruber]AGB17286.1 Rhodanese-related sulfurtransferase [Halovivax ruber XH-70]